VGPLKELNGPLVLFSRFSGSKCPQVPAPPGFRIGFPGIQTEFARFQFANHAGVEARRIPTRESIGKQRENGHESSSF
jgi:hypothetical protein